MEQTTEPALFYAIWAVVMVVGIVLWALGLRAHGRTFGEQRSAPSRGVTEVPTPPAELCTMIARRLTDQGSGLSVRIQECDERGVRAQLFPHVGTDAALATRPDHGATLRCTLQRDGEGSRVSWVVDGRPVTQMFDTAMRAVLALGLCALVAAGVLVPALVISSSEPAVRWQVVQTIQIMHFLWPPFLIAFVARRRRAHVETRTADMLSNLRFL
jgi:hypothetical protein